MNNYWKPIEAKWYSSHRASLAELEVVCCQTHQWVADIAQHHEFVSRLPSASVVVQRLLVRRLGEELRGVELLALNGHGFQAISAAANVFEQSHFLTFVSGSEQRAEQYRLWSNSTRCMANVKQVVKESGVERGWQKVRIDQEYEKYKFLCGFKHNNAMMQRILLLPHPHDPDLFMAKLALADSVWFVLTAVGCLAIQTLSPAGMLEKMNELNALLETVQQLYPNIDDINKKAGA